ncbi:uncharacterized protein F5891DRAFT_740246 [Suillus fuscotomentosus]|uniref:Uncharacterized protein n=1 Tax=Suillus fuscotomentosus TaxID=1912939 RepID=A0AAD4DUF3_9AGAM|nr:uncharacterized protein F5891DRAFT_740246 [Suillus fuscotomentosus]KAG1893962.1 hypothetical protein F5891DRAFT_740246 [Suillus fuscotomentosus]
MMAVPWMLHHWCVQRALTQQWVVRAQLPEWVQQGVLLEGRPEQFQQVKRFQEFQKWASRHHVWAQTATQIPRQAYPLTLEQIHRVWLRARRWLLGPELVRVAPAEAALRVHPQPVTGQFHQGQAIEQPLRRLHQLWQSQ